MLSKTKNYIKNNKRCLLLLYWVLHFAWYEVMVDLTPLLGPYVIYSPLDDLIPFCELFIIPYSVWFFYIAAVELYTLVKGSRKDFIDLSKMLTISLFVSMLIATVFPSTHELRPIDFPRDNFLTECVKFLYKIDNPLIPAVIMPSMHVLVSLVLATVVIKSGCYEGKVKVKISACVLSVFICASTVFTKQHSILDVFAAIGLYVIIYIVTYHIWKTKST